jgi:hypothetical protein
MTHLDWQQAATCAWWLLVDVVDFLSMLRGCNVNHDAQRNASNRMQEPRERRTAARNSHKKTYVLKRHPSFFSIMFRNYGDSV